MKMMRTRRTACVALVAAAMLSNCLGVVVSAADNEVTEAVEQGVTTFETEEAVETVEDYVYSSTSGHGFYTMNGKDYPNFQYFGSAWWSNNVTVTAQNTKRVQLDGGDVRLVSIRYDIYRYLADVEYNPLYADYINEIYTVDPMDERIRTITVYLSDYEGDLKIGDVFTVNFTVNTPVDYVEPTRLWLNDTSFYMRNRPQTSDGMPIVRAEEGDYITELLRTQEDSDAYPKYELNELDINGDGEVNAADAALILWVSAYMGANGHAPDLADLYSGKLD